MDNKIVVIYRFIVCGLCAGKEVAEGFRSALRAALHPSHCLARPLRERPASGPLPLMRPRVATGFDTCASFQTDYSITEEPWDGSQPVKQPIGTLILDADKAGEYVEGRWEQGDWIKPLGAPGRKKMQDWFTDHHIPADEKAFVPLLKSASDPHHVLAVIPYCIDNCVKVTSRTKKIYRVRALVED